MQHSNHSGVYNSCITLFYILLFFIYIVTYCPILLFPIYYFLLLIMYVRTHTHTYIYITQKLAPNIRCVFKFNMILHSSDLLIILRSTWNGNAFYFHNISEQIHIFTEKQTRLDLNRFNGETSLHELVENIRLKRWTFIFSNESITLLYQYNFNKVHLISLLNI